MRTHGYGATLKACIRGCGRTVHQIGVNRGGATLRRIVPHESWKEERTTSRLCQREIKGKGRSRRTITVKR